MATIENLFTEQKDLKKDYREDWAETSRKDWRVDWKSVLEPIIGSITATQTFALAAAGTVVPLTVSASDPNTPALPLTYLWALHTGPSLTFAPIQTPTAATASIVVPSVIGNWVVRVTVSNGTADTVSYVAVHVTA